MSSRQCSRLGCMMKRISVMVSFIMQRKWQVLLVTSVAVFMSFLDVTIVNIAFPDIRASFPESSLGDLSWILNAYNIVFAALLVPAGRLADRPGRRRRFTGGGMTFLAASGAGGAAADVHGRDDHVPCGLGRGGAGADRRGPHRRARGAGGRRGRARADLARAP